MFNHAKEITENHTREITENHAKEITNINNYINKNQESQALNGTKESWRDKKMRTLKLSDSLQRIGKKTKSERVKDCGTVLSFVINGEHKQLHSANFCKARLCPMCQWRKTIEMFKELSQVLDTAKAQYPDLIPCFLTLTLQNCKRNELKATLDALTKGWHRLLNHRQVTSVMRGYFRAIEITYNEKDDTMHPHIHAIVMFDKEYFDTTKTLYISTSRWQELWRTAMKLDYLPICDIRTVKPKGKQKRKAINEVAKYTVKDTDYLKDNDSVTDTIVQALETALKGKRLIAYGGVLKDICKALNENKSLKTAETLNEVAELLVEVYQWHFGLSNYFKISEYKARNGEVIEQNEIEQPKGGGAKLT